MLDERGIRAALAAGTLTKAEKLELLDVLERKAQ
jgi:hypothetical protein